MRAERVPVLCIAVSLAGSRGGTADTASGRPHITRAQVPASWQLPISRNCFFLFRSLLEVCKQINVPRGNSQPIRGWLDKYSTLLACTWTFLSRVPTAWLSPAFHCMPLPHSHFRGVTSQINHLHRILASGSALKWAQWRHLVHSRFSVNIYWIDGWANKFSLCLVWD